MQIPRLLYKYLRYRFKSFRLHGVHSPFVFDLYEQVICHDGRFRPYDLVETLRRKLLKDQTLIAITDFGAGSKATSETNRKIREIAQVSAKPAKYGQLLFRLVNYFQPRQVLELGTSLGLTTAYLATARPSARVTTVEGCPNIAARAQENFKSLKIKNINLVVGNLDEALPRLVEASPPLDFVFFDGNHRYAPTMAYFETCLTKHHEKSVFILDDIYWSKEMEKAWQEIKRHPQVTLTIDLFWIGLVFFRKNQAREHFTLAY